MDTQAPEAKNVANRYAHIRTAFELGDRFADDVSIWYHLGRDILPLLEDQRERRQQIERGEL